MEYGATGFTQSTGTFITASNDTITLSGLTVGVTYDVYKVQQNDTIKILDLSENDIEKEMQQKAEEFKEKGSEIYQKA